MRIGRRGPSPVQRPTSLMGLRLFADVRDDRGMIARLGPHKDGQGAIEVLDAAFRLILKQRFGPSYDLEDVRGLVRGMQYYLENKVSSEDAETVVRAGLGEDVDTSHLTRRSRFLSQLIAFIAIARIDLELSDEQLYALLVEAEQIVEKSGRRPQQAVL